MTSVLFKTGCVVIVFTTPTNELNRNIPNIQAIGTIAKEKIALNKFLTIPAFEFPFSLDGEAEKIWLTLRENESYKLIGLINLCGNDDDHWNAGKDAPVEQRSLTVHVLADSPCGVWYASPDMENGHSLPLTFKKCNTNLGNEITFVVPKLINCGVVWIEL